MQRLRNIYRFLCETMAWRVLKSPKFLLPVLAIFVFAIAALSSTIRFLSQDEGLFSYALEHSVAVRELEDHFHDFEEQVFFYASGKDGVSAEDILKHGKDFHAELRSFMDSGWIQLLDPELRPVLGALNDAFVVADHNIRNTDFLKTRKLTPLLTQPFIEMHEALEAMDADSKVHQDRIGTYEDRQASRQRIVWSVLLMGLSGFVLIAVLLDRLASLERVDEERRRAVDLEARRAAAMDEAFEGMVLSDALGAIVYANRASRQSAGWEGPREELVGKSWGALFSRDQGRRFESDILPRLEEEERWSGSAFGLRKDGRVFPLDVSVARLADGGHIWVLRDLSRQVESERVSQRRLAAIEATGDGIGIVGPDGKLSYMNQAMQDIHGVPEDEELRWIGKPWDALYQGKDVEWVHAQVLPGLMQTGYWTGEFEMTRLDGRRIWAEMGMTRLPDGGIVSTIRDVSDRKRAELEKEELQAQFHQAQKMEAVGRLAGGIAHDFNNILAAIMGYAEFLDEDLEKDPERKKFAEGILQAGGQARGLIDQLLSFSRRKETTKSTLDMSGVVNETLSLLRASLPRTIDLETDVDSGMPVVANATQIAQAVMNLCVNARDAMEDAHGTIEVCLESVDADPDLYEDMLADDFPAPDVAPPIRVHDVDEGHCCLELGVLVRGQRYARLSVADTGSGMSRAVMEHIFEPFFTTKDVDKGTGLGLANVHGVVSAHRGALVVDSVLGDGTRFDLFFPMADVQPEAIGTAKGSGVEIQAPAGGRILLVEDQEAVRDMMAVLLRRLGYEVDFCESGVEALPHLRQFPDRYDLVVTDHNMPRMTGLELADQVSQDVPGLPFIIVSGYSKESLDATSGRHPAVKAILRKPVDRQALAAAIRDVMNGSAAAA